MYRGPDTWAKVSYCGRSLSTLIDISRSKIP